MYLSDMCMQVKATLLPITVPPIICPLVKDMNQLHFKQKPLNNLQSDTSMFH